MEYISRADFVAELCRRIICGTVPFSVTLPSASFCVPIWNYIILFALIVRTTPPLLASQPTLNSIYNNLKNHLLQYITSSREGFQIQLLKKRI